MGMSNPAVRGLPVMRALEGGISFIFAIVYAKILVSLLLVIKSQIPQTTFLSA